MRKIQLVIFLIGILFAVNLFAASGSNSKTPCLPPENIGSKLIESLTTLYGPNFKQVYRSINVKGCTSPLAGEGWRAVVFLTEAEIRNGEKVSLPIVTLKLGDQYYLTPALVSVTDARNYALFWEIALREPKNLPHENRFLLSGNPDQCSHSLEVFSDPECPFCQRFVPSFIRQARERNMCVYHYCYPLRIHRHARKYCKYLSTALEYVESEKRADFLVGFYQTVKNRGDVEQYIFSRLPQLKKEDFYKKALDNSEPDEVEQLAGKLSVSGTPTVFVDGKKVPNQYVGDFIEALVDGNIPGLVQIK